MYICAYTRERERGLLYVYSTSKSGSDEYLNINLFLSKNLEGLHMCYICTYTIHLLSFQMLSISILEQDLSTQLLKTCDTAVA